MRQSVTENTIFNLRRASQRVFVDCMREPVSSADPARGVAELVFESPVSRLEKDRNWTRLDRKKDRTAVLVFHI